MKTRGRNSSSTKFRALVLACVARVNYCISGRFCGLAVNNEQGNGWNNDQLRIASDAASALKLWHYNWLPSTDVHVTDVEFVPTIKFPGQVSAEIPYAGTGSAGYTVKGWNEPDDPGQAGSIHALRTNPEGFAQAWTDDMLAASAKGYTDFVGPAMAHDSCWLDHFLKACEVTGRCKELVTYLALHRYRQDCSTYVASSDYQGWREDLSYILSFYNIMQKYNARGFQIKGLVWDEFGCLTNNFQDAAPEQHQQQYLTEWYENTVIKLFTGDTAIVDKIKSTQWIGPNEPDAHAGQYSPGSCQWSNGGTQAASDAVEAIRAIKSMAWFNIHVGKNYLFTGTSLTLLGQTYFTACSRVPGSGQGRGGVGGCRTAVPSDECYSHVVWARDVGIHQHPDWYPEVPPSPTFDHFQQDLWKKGIGDCPRPCKFLLSSTVGFREVCTCLGLTVLLMFRGC